MYRLATKCTTKKRTDTR